MSAEHRTIDWKTITPETYAEAFRKALAESTTNPGAGFLMPPHIAKKIVRRGKWWYHVWRRLIGKPISYPPMPRLGWRNPFVRPVVSRGCPINLPRDREEKC
jgi:hypothetical protein